MLPCAGMDQYTSLAAAPAKHDAAASSRHATLLAALHGEMISDASRNWPRQRGHRGHCCGPALAGSSVAISLPRGIEGREARTVKDKRGTLWQVPPT